jgi:hypothetical protein
MEVCPFARGVMLQPLSTALHDGIVSPYADDPVGYAVATPIHRITRWHSLFPSSCTRIPVGPSCDGLSREGRDTGLPCSVDETIMGEVRSIHR